MSDHNHHHHERDASQKSLDRLALSATLHCLAGCSIGEVAGLVIGTALNWGMISTVALAIALAFLTGYAFTLVPLARVLPLKTALKIALAADTASITAMEIVDNLVMVAIPGAMHAGITSSYFWISMAIALAAGGLAAYPVNRYLIARGRGHAVVHAHH